jgi:uncharacterized membrane protein
MSGKSKNQGKFQPSQQNHPTQNQILFQQTSGPLPAPNVLLEYDKNHPGFAERIMVMAEKEQSHRHVQESSIVQADIVVNKEILTERKRGQYLAFGIAVIAISAGTYAGINGASLAGSIIGGGGVVGLVSAFLYNRKAEPEKRK